jgi:hypothetical protein
MEVIDSFVKEEVDRIHAEENFSEFEFYMMGQIMAWCLGQEKKFGSTKNMVNAFWDERLD